MLVLGFQRRSSWATFVIVSFLLLSAFPPLSKHPFTWDLFGYFLYLPLSIIHQDLGISDYSIIETIRNHHYVSDSVYQIYRVENGNWIIRYPIGMALLAAPFYGVAHLIAGVFGLPQDGMSSVYQYSLLAAVYTYFLLGLWLLRGILKRYFGDITAGLSLAFLFFGTNIISHFYGDFPGVHVVLLGLFAITIALTDILYRKQKEILLLPIGLIIGLCCVTRPSSVLILLVVFLWGVTNWASFRTRLLLLFRKRVGYVLLGVLLGTLPILLQMTYWYVYAGEAIYNSYNNVGEGLDWFQPHTWNALFSYRNGWFVYTPLALVAIVALFFIKHPYLQRQRLAFLVFILLNIYVVSSWTCWWYGGGFGHRAFVESYAVLVFPLAALISKALQWKPPIKWSFLVGLAVLLAFNVFQFKQFLLRIIPVDRMSGAYYKAVFLSMDEGQKAEHEHLLLYDTRLPFEESMEKYPFQQDTVERIAGTFDTLHAKKPFSKAIQFPYNQLPEADATWLSIAMDVPVETACGWIWVTTMFRENENYGYKAFDMCQETPIAVDSINGKATYQLHYLLPHVRHNSDRLRMYMWNANNLSDTVAVSNVIVTNHSLIKYP